MKLFPSIRALFQRRRLEAEMAEEMRLHLERRIEEKIAAGMLPGEARFAAQREFGHMEGIKEEAREGAGFRWLHDLGEDTRYGLRQLRKNPGFTAVAVVSLALGIGANTAIFTLANGFLFQDLPVRNPGDLVRFRWQPAPDGGVPGAVRDPSSILDREQYGSPGTETTSQAFSLQIFERFREQTELLDEVFAFGPLDAAVITIDGQAERGGFGHLVSGNYYRGLGVTALHGRLIGPEDDRPGAPPVAVISHRFWQARFNGDPAAVGRILLLHRQPITIIGVTPPGLPGTILDAPVPDLVLPLALAPTFHLDEEATLKPSFWWLNIMGRLKPGVTQAQVQAGYTGVFQAAARDGVSKPDVPPHLLITPGASPYSARMRRSVAAEMALPAGMVGLILATACANVANLQLARGASRRREIAARLALGAGRGRIVRQLLTESILLGLLGTAVGLPFGVLAQAAAQAAWDWPLTTLDGHVFGFAAALGIATGIGFGLVPALRATRLDLATEFQGCMRLLGGRPSRLSRGLIIVQVTVCFVLLTGTGLLLRTVVNLRSAALGFESGRLVMFDVDPVAGGYGRDQYAELYGRIIDRIRALPGVDSATFATTPPWNTGRRVTIAVPGNPSPFAGEDRVSLNQAGPSFFDTFGIKVLLGRPFVASDSATAPKVAIVNQAFVQKYFGGENPLGRRIDVGLTGRGANQIGGEREIVGVVNDVKQEGLRSLPLPFVHIPYAQGASDGADVAVRTAGDPVLMVAVVQQMMHEVEPGIPRPTFRTGNEQRDKLMTVERLFAVLGALLGVVALGLAGVGLYGLMSYTVLRRTGEIGLRMALGAEPGRVLWMVLYDSLRLVGVGVAIGLFASVAAVRAIAAMLYGLTGTDPLTYGAVAMLLGVVALLACWLPARRAAKVDPMTALRAE